MFLVFGYLLVTGLAEHPQAILFTEKSLNKAGKVGVVP